MKHPKTVIYADAYAPKVKASHRHLSGVSIMEEPILIGGISAPSSVLARKAASLVDRVHSTAMKNHVHRTWWFSEFLGRKRGMKYDREAV
jgi:hypothetical protein